MKGLSSSIADGVRRLSIRLYARADESTNPDNAIPIFLSKFIVQDVEETIDFAYDWGPTVILLAPIVLYLAMSDPAIRFYQRRRHSQASPTLQPTKRTRQMIALAFLQCFLLSLIVSVVLMYILLHHHSGFRVAVSILFKHQAVRRVWQGRNRYHHWVTPRDFPRFECMIKHSLGCEAAFLRATYTPFIFWCKSTFSYSDGTLTVVLLRPSLTSLSRHTYPGGPRTSSISSVSYMLAAHHKHNTGHHPRDWCLFDIASTGRATNNHSVVTERQQDWALQGLIRIWDFSFLFLVISTCLRSVYQSMHV